MTRELRDPLCPQRLSAPLQAVQDSRAAAILATKGVWLPQQLLSLLESMVREQEVEAEVGGLSSIWKQ